VPGAFARLKHSSGCSGCESGATQKLIKEDHFLRAPQGCLRFRISNLKFRSETRILVSDPSCTQDFRTHILAAFRLFTCQRASFPQWGGGILSSIPQLSTTGGAFAPAIHNSRSHLVLRRSGARVHQRNLFQATRPFAPRFRHRSRPEPLGMVPAAREEVSLIFLLLSSDQFSVIGRIAS
jgi:hypothetical protein